MTDIETLRALRDEQTFSPRYECSSPARTPEQIAALTRTIALLEAMDAAKGDEKVWRGGISNLFDSIEHYGIIPAWMKNDAPIIVLPAAAHDALIARCAALERQVATMREALEKTVSSLRYPDNGVHYCRSCNAGTHNKWQHEGYCIIDAQCALIDKVKEQARRALAQEGGEQHEH